MKIKLTKKRNSMSVRFSAEGDREGVDLKNIVMAAGKKPVKPFMEASIAELERRGYRGGVTKETRNTREFTLRAPENPAEGPPAKRPSKADA
jgi:hypothetical protein